VSNQGHRLRRPVAVRDVSVWFTLLALAGVALIGCGGGVNSGFAPKQIPDLALWLDAGAIEKLQDGDNLGTWLDSSGRGNDAIQELGTKRPKYVKNTRNGLPTVRFDGQNDVLVIPDSNSLDVGFGDLTILVVYSRGDSPTTNLRLLAKGATTDRGQGYAIMGDNTALLLIVSNGEAERRLVGLPDQVVGQATLGTFVVNRGIHMRAYRDGASKSTRSLGGFGIKTWSNNDPLTIGGQNPTPSIPWKGDIMELLIYKRQLSDFERVPLEAYLAEKWSIKIEKD